jgi:hypothetical protein
MPQLIEEHDEPDDFNAERWHNSEQRERLKACLPDIAAEVTRALDDAGIAVSVYFTVPNSGSLLTFATPADPNDAIWDQISGIVTKIVSQAVGRDDLICQEAACVAAGTMMSAADLLTYDEPNSQWQ